ncbi:MULTISPECIES: efflux RND transporter periplasmic adaptor subunit [unclassified Bradyrhizobium]|uniref:efflux RND transporter periplasmic adaptor subunit n=1 Tax=unclassified Bradyrhizobium TaxID=2631580 RepID=UPI0020B1E56C|nr:MULTISPECIES: efflux RND transporter periplasmic adaptor subunit [unclassified Bradyrhizobium]MCP3401935.1 efflux RND transporter periplasmic adaptor subunit [Bradyrhizobium sp. CCGB20]MCP3410420.1 efflux RND transporter periplasmic adaptor subunit [Bradyrhizobium sp. CCGB01]
MFRLRWRLLICAGLVVLGLQACSDKKQEGSEDPVRGLRAYKVSAKAESRVRRFPSVLQPADVSSLSFEIAGQLKAIALTVGQKVQLGDVLAEIDPRSLQTQVEQAGAGVQQAQAQADNAEADFQRKDELLKKGVSTQSVFDQARATLLSTKAQLDQAKRQLDLASHNLERGKLVAPFSGTIARIEVKSFAQIAAGQPILTLYSDDRFELSFLAPAPVFQSLAVGRAVDVKVADLPDLELTGEIKELGSKAEQVSAFPVVVRLENKVAGLNAGMSVEASIEEPLNGGSAGFLVPLGVVAPESASQPQGAASVFLYDGASSTVKKHKVMVGGVRDNRLIVTSGLAEGDIVASAGVSYLVDGQKVKLLPVQE